MALLELLSYYAARTAMFVYPSLHVSKADVFSQVWSFLGLRHVPSLEDFLSVRVNGSAITQNKRRDVKDTSSHEHSGGTTAVFVNAFSLVLNVNTESYRYREKPENAAAGRGLGQKPWPPPASSTRQGSGAR